MEKKADHDFFVWSVESHSVCRGRGLSALIVMALKNQTPFDDYLIFLIIIASVSGILHWLESWVAHDMAFRLLAEMRIQVFRKLDQIAPAYLVRRRTGDLMGIVTQDVELVEYFFAHTVCLLYTSPSPRDRTRSRMPSSA